MKTKHIATYGYKNDDGFAFFVGDAPPQAKTKADVISFLTVKKSNTGELIESCAMYLTPDEAFAVAQGLLACVDHIMKEKFMEYRKEKDLIV